MGERSEPRAFADSRASFSTKSHRRVHSGLHSYSCLACDRLEGNVARKESRISCRFQKEAWHTSRSTSQSRFNSEEVSRIHCKLRLGKSLSTAVGWGGHCRPQAACDVRPLSGDNLCRSQYRLGMGTPPVVVVLANRNDQDCVITIEVKILMPRWPVEPLQEPVK